MAKCHQLSAKWVSIVIVRVLAVCFFISASTRLGQGIKVLSNLNMLNG